MAKLYENVDLTIFLEDNDEEEVLKVLEENDVEVLDYSSKNNQLRIEVSPSDYDKVEDLISEL